MLLRLIAMLSAILLTIGSAMQQAKYDETNGTRNTPQHFLTAK
jgi:4-hydroxybenzoate polyprenyltransferase